MATKKKRNQASASRSGRSGSQRHATPFYNDLMGIAGSLLRSRQQDGAEKISSLAGAARNMAAELPEVPYVQTYVSATADQIDMLADYVSQNSLEQMVEDGTALAKRHPVLTLASAIAVGYVVTRLAASKRQGSDRKDFPRNNRAPTRRSHSRPAIRAKANGTDRSHESTSAS